MRPSHQQPASAADLPPAADWRAELRDAARRTLDRSYPFDARCRAWLSPPGFDPAQWARFAELGWLGVGLPEAAGGFGGVAEQVVLAEELGRALVIEPWLANCGLAGPLLGELAELSAPNASSEPGSVELQPLLEGLIAGRSQVAFAAWEHQGRYDAFDVTSRAQLAPALSAHAAHAPAWQLDGRKTAVLAGASADHWLVLARTAGTHRDLHGLSLFLVPTSTSGCRLQDGRSYDARQTAELHLEAVRLPPSARLGPLHQAWPIVARAIDRAIVLLCAESVGTMERSLHTTRDYLGTRRQFGQRILDNQVIKHRLVDMYVLIEQSRAITEAAAEALDEERLGLMNGAAGADQAARGRAERAVSLAKAFVGPAGQRVGEEAVQLHGAIGMTDEYDIGQAYKRLAGAANRWGDAHWHGSRLLASVP